MSTPDEKGCHLSSDYNGYIEYEGIFPWLHVELHKDLSCADLLTFSFHNHLFQADHPQQHVSLRRAGWQSGAPDAVWSGVSVQCLQPLPPLLLKHLFIVAVICLKFWHWYHLSKKKKETLFPLFTTIGREQVHVVGRFPVLYVLNSFHLSASSMSCAIQTWTPHHILSGTSCRLQPCPPGLPCAVRASIGPFHAIHPLTLAVYCALDKRVYV